MFKSQVITQYGLVLVHSTAVVAGRGGVKSLVLVTYVASHGTGVDPLLTVGTLQSAATICNPTANISQHYFSKLFH